MRAWFAAEFAIGEILFDNRAWRGLESVRHWLRAAVLLGLIAAAWFVPVLMGISSAVSVVQIAKLVGQFSATSVLPNVALWVLDGCWIAAVVAALMWVWIAICARTMELATHAPSTPPDAPPPSGLSRRAIGRAFRTIPTIAAIAIFSALVCLAVKFAFDAPLVRRVLAHTLEWSESVRELVRIGLMVMVIEAALPALAPLPLLCACLAEVPHLRAVNVWRVWWRLAVPREAVHLLVALLANPGLLACAAVLGVLQANSHPDEPPMWLAMRFIATAALVIGATLALRASIAVAMSAHYRVRHRIPDLVSLATARDETGATFEQWPRLAADGFAPSAVRRWRSRAVIAITLAVPLLAAIAAIRANAIVTAPPPIDHEYWAALRARYGTLANASHDARRT